MGEAGLGSFRKEGIAYFHTDYFQCYLWVFGVHVYMFCLYSPFPSVLFVFHGNNLFSLHIINRYMTSTCK